MFYGRGNQGESRLFSMKKKTKVGMLKHKYLNFMGYAQSIILSTFVKRFVKISMPIVIAIIQQFKLFYL